METDEVAYLRKRQGGRFSLVVYWKGKKHPKALWSTDSVEAEKIKRDAEEQLRRIRAGESQKAAQLLADGYSIIDVLFGCPEIDKRMASDPEACTLTLRELADAYLDFQLPTVGSDEQYNSTARFRRLCDFFGDDFRIMRIHERDLDGYRLNRERDGLNGTSLHKEFGSLKAVT